jgi:proteasome lid subunit RPN8/RPN11
MKRKKEEAAKDDVSAGPWKDQTRPEWRKFPGPPGTAAELRVCLTRTAFADITAHGKESLEGEVCGILAGRLCEDDDGVFLDVEAAVRGTGVRAGRGHVTFTQETWNGIHAALERDHPKLQILGWYHTHPGFGVLFSEMDTFIQRNFFSLPTQVAFVMDPLGGDVALGTTAATGLRYLDRFWVEGREHRARVPAPPGAAGADSGAPASDVAALEVRVSQLVASVQDLRRTLHRVVMAALMTVGVGMIVIVGYTMYRSFIASIKPPEGLTYLPVPVAIDGKPALIGFAVVKWELPPELMVVPLEPKVPEPESPRPDQEKTK